MNLLADILTYIRRILKTPSNQVITDALLIDYVNRFWLMDVDARIQVFDLKTVYQFQTAPGIDRYNMPLYSVQSQGLPENQVSVYLANQQKPNGSANYLTNLLSTIQTSATLVPGSVEVWLDLNLSNQTVYQDDGAGNLVYIAGPFTISAGSVNYSTGFISLTFTSIPGTGIPVNASYDYAPTVSGPSVAMFPVYQNLMGPCYINGIEMPFYTQRMEFFNTWPNYNQTLVEAGIGNGTNGPYTLQLPFLPNSPAAINFPPSAGIIRGHVDITGIIQLNNTLGTGNTDPPLDSGTGASIPAIPTTSVYSQIYFTTIGNSGANQVVADSGVFLNTSDLNSQNYGLLMSPGSAPYGNTILPNGGSLAFPYTINQNTINYVTGIATNVYFPEAIPEGYPISGQCVYYQLGIPRACLFYNNTLHFRAPPNTQYLIELNAYLTPAAFFNTNQAIPFGYMAEYIARGAARKILSDTGDWEQFNAYEPLFKEQETLVHIRSQRVWTSTRTGTIYSGQGYPNTYNNSSFGV